MASIKASRRGDKTRQTIDGVGVCGAFHQGHHIKKKKNTNLQNEIMDLLFSKEKGLGVSILRNIVGDSGSWGDTIDGPTPSVEPEKGVFDFTTDDQMWFSQEAKKRGCEKFFATVWSPPAWMKTNGSVLGGSVKASCYQDFAEYLAAYVTGYKKHHGLDICAISPANEPDLKTPYSSCIWPGDQYADFLKNYLKPEFKRQGITSLVVAPELTEFSEKTINGVKGLGYLSLFEDDEAMNAVDVIGMHLYDDSEFKPLKEEHRRGKPFWMTEFCELKPSDFITDLSMRSGLTIAKSVHQFLTAAGGNAYIYYWACTVKLKGSNTALIYLDLQNETFSAAERACAFGNYSRFIRPDAVRLEITETPAEGIYLSAYRNADGKTVVVAINETGIESEVSLTADFFDGALTPYRTPAEEHLKELPSISINEDGTFTLTLAPQSVTSFVE